MSEASPGRPGPSVDISAAAPAAVPPPHGEPPAAAPTHAVLSGEKPANDPAGPAASEPESESLIDDINAAVGSLMAGIEAGFRVNPVFSSAVAAAAGLFAAFVWAMWDVWQSNADIADRWIIPLMAVWAAWVAWENAGKVPARPSGLGLPLVWLGAALFPVGWWMAGLAGMRILLQYWLLGCLQLMAVGLAATGLGWARTWQLVFPVAFLLFMLPTPGSLDGMVRPPLQGWAAGLSTWMLENIAGIPVTRAGLQMHLPSGAMEVVEACSGIRSLNGLLAIGAFVAFLRGLAIPQGGALLLLVVPIAVLCNSIRIFATGVIQETAGPEWTKGQAHEMLGFAMLLIGLGITAATSLLFEPTEAAAAGSPGSPDDAGSRSEGTPEPPAVAVEASPSPAAGPAGLSPLASMAALAPLALSAAVAAWAGLSAPSINPEAPIAQVATELAGWKGEPAPIDERYRDTLGYTDAVHRIYRHSDGRVVDAWVIFWKTNENCSPHTPDQCLPGAGWQPFERGHAGIRPGGVAREVPIETRRYRRPGEELTVFFMTQEGRRYIEAAEVGFTSPHAWFWDILYGKRPEVGRNSRLQVLLYSNGHLNPAEADATMRGFSTQLIGELYRVCPWAAPAPSAASATP
jgi:exosortase